jgi:hypothetical protein
MPEEDWIGLQPPENSQRQSVQLSTAFPSKLKWEKEVPLIYADLYKMQSIGFNRQGGGRWPPVAGDIRSWMQNYGIGIDCSGFVYWLYGKFKPAGVGKQRLKLGLHSFKAMVVPAAAGEGSCCGMRNEWKLRPNCDPEI